MSLSDSDSDVPEAVIGTSSGKTADGSLTGKTVSSRMSALVTDTDAELAQKHLHLLERKFRMEVTTAVTRQEIHAAHRQGFDIVFMSITLPVLDGIEVTKIMRRMKLHGKIVGLYDDDVDEDDLKAFIDAGLDACIKKPLTEEKVKLILQNTKSE